MNLALQKTWQAQDLDFEDTPVKSSLSEARSKISFSYFKDIYEADLKRFDKARKTYKGLYVYAVDGDDLNLPCSEDVLNQGYRGRLYAKGFETHYPKMYTVYAYDILNGLFHQFEYSAVHRELKSALELIPKFEKNSVTIYDRLYGSYPTMSAHANSGSYFVIRLKTNGDSIPTLTKNFIRSDQVQMEVEWESSKGLGDAVKVRLVKFISSKTKKLMIFATDRKSVV